MMGCGKVLLIEGREDSETILRSLISDEFVVIPVRESNEVVKTARAELPDIILADFDLSNSQILTVLKEIRLIDSMRHIAVFVISNIENEDQRILVYQMGVDDLICRPFAPRELLARISSKLRRIQEVKRHQPPLVCGGLVLDLEKIEARENGKLISLSVLEFNLLKYFVENKDRVLSRRNILDAVWVDSIVSDRTVDTHIACLRRKLNSTGFLLMTIYGAGYTLKTTGGNEVSDLAVGLSRQVLV